MFRGPSMDVTNGRHRGCFRRPMTCITDRAPTVRPRLRDPAPARLIDSPRPEVLRRPGLERQAADMAGRIVGWMHRHDPEGNARHKAIKVAIAVTVGWPSGPAIGNGQLSLFASPSAGSPCCCSPISPAPGSARLGAYVGLYAAGPVLITLGTLASKSPGSPCWGWRSSASSCCSPECSARRSPGPPAPHCWPSSCR